MKKIEDNTHTLDYSTMKPTPKSEGPPIDYSKLTAPKHTEIKKQEQIKQKMIQKHSKAPNTELVQGKNKTVYVVNKPKNILT